MTFQLQADPTNVFFRCVEDSSESIMLSDAKGVLLYVNPAWERIYGYRKDEALGKTARLLHSGHHSAKFYAEMWSDILNPEIGHWKGEVINRAKNGQLIPVLLSITPFKSLSGEILGYMGMAIDLSHRKELEAKVLHQDRLASIGLLASGLAHEVGTPLGVIRGRAEFLQMQAQDPAVAKSLAVITSQIDRISKLIRSLLRISRSFSDVRIESIDLKSVVDEVLTLLGPNLKEDSVEIHLDIPEGLLVAADFNRMEQVLLNLITNSIHAIRRAAGDGRTQGHTVEIKANQRHAKVALEIRDSGCGITSENMKKLFKPFFTTKEIGEGTGLGLAIVAQLIQEMKSEISVQSTPGTGTTFTVLLNAADDG